MSARAPGPDVARGLGEALRAAGHTLADLVRVRGALFALEVREELHRRQHMLALAVLAAVFLQLALLMLAALVVSAFWDTYRNAALLAMGVLYLACGAATLLRLRRTANESPAPFAATSHELAQDLAAWRSPP